MRKIPLPLALATAAAIAGAMPASAQNGSRMIEEMQKADRNNDGAVSRDELLAYRSSQFDRLDRNDDGVLTQADMPRIAKIRERMETATARFDSDGDGRITRAEFTSAPTAGFDRADRNNDGVVTKSELNAARAALKSEFGR